MEAYLETARARTRARRRRLEARRSQALELAHRAAARLKDEFGVSRVVIFGSVLKPRLFHERSDVDLAVWGWTSGDTFAPWGCCSTWSPVSRWIWSKPSRPGRTCGA